MVPQSIDGQLILDQPGGEFHSVTWFTLPHALPVIGASAVDVEIAADLEAARAHSRDNLRSYWVGSVVHGIRAALAGRPPNTSLEHPGTLVWVVLGAPRLAMFLDPQAAYAGPVPTKSEAGWWVVSHRREYADLARRAVAARAGANSAFTVADALSAANLVDSLVS
ncbi:MAG: hypothetical protein Q4P07_06585 [Ornithinimicrobium sp.]|uniref:hypothetical protein n=1 Tax=Ornithinimicrobium sp. TaxID=1977084 RepID=UPI0026DFFBF8|nr:hypothetical protein [Ornithinimicrobium sp.]MDO5739799.1 hypothetical protein [Ornithinimicrobium sp.]